MNKLITLTRGAVTAVVFSVGTFTTIAGDADRLWYSAPAKEWIEAVPLGNGRLAAMVYGGTDHDTVALNEISMWSGAPDPTSNDLCGAEGLAEMREAFLSGDVAKGSELGEKYLNGRMTTYGTHLPVGNLTIDFDLPAGEDTDYIRTLDMSEALATVDFKRGKNKISRRYIADYPDDVIAMRYDCKDTPFTATVGLDLLRKADITATGNGLEFDGKVDFPMHGPGGVAFCGVVRVIPDGGSVTAGNGTVTVTGAKGMTLIVDIRTDYNNHDYRRLAHATAEYAASTDFRTLLERHRKDYTPLYSRVEVDFGGHRDLPTDERLRRIRLGEKDSGFDALFFNYGRYMLIASSRPSGMPLCANLQGIWNDNMACNMPWTCDYHLDINIQQNYWSANRVNLGECNEPLFSYLGLLAEHGAETARRMYGCDGWVAHTVSNPWGYTAPGWGVGWGMNVTGGAWLATHVWSHYQYTKDDEFLRKTGYPIIKECARFFKDYMVEDPKTGWLLTGPSVSPENGYIATDGSHRSLSMMPTIDRVVVHDIYEACIGSADALGIEDDFTAALRRDIKKLPPLGTDGDGLLREWLEPVKRSDPSHRHSSHLLGLFPCNQISYTRNPDLVAACRRSLDNQTSDPNWEDTEWSTANMLCFRARTKEADAAYGWLRNLYGRFMRENLMTVSPAGIAGAQNDIFSFDANEAAVAGMCEMLLQSYDGFLEFLPALPAEWATGSVKGICAEGGITVDMEWHDGRMRQATLLANRDTDVNVKGFDAPIHLRKDKAYKLKF